MTARVRQTPRIAARRLILRRILSLPAPVLRLMSGGQVVYRGGRTLDPRLQFLAARAAAYPPLNSMSPEAARQAFTEGFGALSTAGDPRVGCEDLSLGGARGVIPARAYRPAGQDPVAPLLVYAHMGGGVVGDLETCHAFCAILAMTARCPVLSVNYGLAPEHRFPAGLDDVLAAYRWGRDNAGRFGAPPGQAAIGGDSMGGNFAAVICQVLRRAGEPQPALQLLVYPFVDAADDRPSMTLNANTFPLSRALMDWFVDQYVGAGDSPDDPRLSPLREPDLADLAPAVVATAGFDPLLDQGEAYARGLREAGVPVVYRAYDSLAHGFTSFTGAVPAADAACREIAALVREALAP